MKLKPFYLPLLIILAGIVFSIYLQWQVPDGVYFSGDAGLKALLARQLSDGILHFDLVPPAQGWVRDLWAQGLYPYDKPYVYNVADKYYITFPFTFPLVTAPFEALFGYRGLYLIPLISTWAIWFIFYWVCQQLKLNNLDTSLALISLIFASPITIYSAMYWEHTLALVLAFAGTAILFVSKELSGLSIKNAVISGSLIGLSVWFRPEFLCWVITLAVLVYFAALTQTSLLASLRKKINLDSLAFLSKNKNIFVASTLVTIGLFFLCNKLIYNHPLGIHAIQVVEESSLAQKLKDSWKSFRQLGFAFFQYFPVALFLLILPLLSLFKTTKSKFNLKLFLTYLICIFFIIGVSLIVPPGKQGLIAGGKQWGARFLFILIPMVSVVTFQELTRLRETGRSILGYTALFIISLLLIWGIHKNTYEATGFLQKNYQGVLPAIEFLQKSPNNVIAISHQYVAQAIEASLRRDKLLFWVENQKDLEKLSLALLAQKQQRFIYICYPHRPCELPKQTSENLKIYQKNRDLKIKFLNLGKFGKYPIYEGTIIERSRL
ncbi:dolichol-phosphate mannosyltransferase [Hydrococcus rivularis NIES-593]|uniref:Dolichol-phosphate mannosyltransferase n=1 Tax=Hydrococcus rivularis NIES-593 TaxID=1921803 RepID=A0A1U7HNS2_9CYAN|nr:dolichol-phosphate mannosyltransferase [Hydrococcus rivularis]OKH25236.1 dolichol-phosphate mannosyltransferase [Hydrococcus rivularis NIES-593]